jgi:hypothetical protein
MTLTGVKTKTPLSGVLAIAGPWQALVAKGGWRVYPFDLGCLVRQDTVNTTVLTYGLGDFSANDYVLPCRPTFYGDSELYIPQLSMVTRVATVPGGDDTLTLTTARTLYQGDLLFNLGTDGAPAPLSQPNYDGSPIDIYTDNAGVNISSNKYVSTGRGGSFRGWIENGYSIVDLLVTDEAGIPRFANPFHYVGAGV